VGLIYKITNIANNKVYIGQSTNPAPIRWLYHYKSFLYGDAKYPLYKDMREYGITNFVFQVIEDNIPEIDLDSKEIYYISEYKANDDKYGYNMTMGGNYSHASFLSEQDVRNIIKDIQDNPTISLSEISRWHNVNWDLVSDINCGEIWKFPEYTYPIRLSHDRANKLTEEQVNDIIQCLLSGENCTSISKKYAVSNVCISNINKGSTYRREDLQYPLYQHYSSRPKLTIQDVKTAVDYLTKTQLSYDDIGKIINRGHHTVSGIDRGVMYTDFLNQLNIHDFPIRKK
jgi:group I intron endonuclease